MDIKDFNGNAILFNGCGEDVSNAKGIEYLIRGHYKEYGVFPNVYLATKVQRFPDARDMVLEYILNNFDEYENQSDYCLEQFSDNDYALIQLVLNDIGKSTAFTHYVQKQPIEYCELKNKLMEE